MLAQDMPVPFLHGKGPLDVRGRLTGITILFVVLTVGILVHTGITFQAQKSDGLIIDIAGRQRMLHERHLNEVLLVSRGSTVDYQSTRRILNESLGSLIQGGPVLLTIGKDDVVELPAAPSKAIRAKLNAQRGLLETFSREADAFLRLRPGDQGYGAALQALMDLNGDLQRAANEAVRLLDEHATSKLYTVITWEVAVALIIGVLGVFFTRQAKQAQDDLQREVGVRREAELQAASQEARVRAILNSTADGIITMDESGTVLSFNPAAEQMFEYRSEEVIGRNVTMLMPPAYREQHRDSLGRYLETGEARVIGRERELVGLRQDGQTFPVAIRISEMHHSGERVFIGTIRNISEQKRSEQEAQRAQALIHSIVENLPDMVFVKDATDHRFVRFNKAGEDLLGYSREELIGKNDYDFFPKEEADFFWEKDCEVLEGGQLVDIPEEPIETRHKGVRVLRTKKVPIVGSDGVPEYLLGISEDITERKETEEELRKSEEKTIAALRQSDALKSALLSSVSHELRTPLTAIKTMVSSLIGTGRNIGRQIREEFLVGIDREIDYLSSLVDNLLDMSKIEAGTLEPRREWHLLEDLVEASIRRHGKGLQSRQLEVRLAEDIPSILVDGVEIQRVLVNLLDNAIKYSPSKSQVRVEAAAKPQRLEVWVSNAGPGIPREDLQRVFDRFYRVPSGSGHLKPGTGLGLAICKGIIDAHGGRIWAESTPGRDTTITFTLPLGGQPPPPGDLVRKASE